MSVFSGTKSTPRVCIIGAGLSGLCMAIKLKTQLQIDSFVIYEANSEVGGTWFANSYPGCECDVLSLLYCFSFAPKYDWSRFFAPQAEILEYSKQITEQYGIYPHIQFKTRVDTLVWNEKSSNWSVTTSGGSEGFAKHETFDLIVNSTGKLHAPFYPTKFLDFQGQLLHSGEWDHSVKLTNKRVGIVGTGASAVQIIAEIASQVEHLTVFQRNAPYILPRIQAEMPGFAKWFLAKTPGLYKLVRTIMFACHEWFHGITDTNSWRHKIVNKVTHLHRKFQLGDPELFEKATPKYALAHKRMILSEKYYPALSQPNVTLVTDQIDEVKGNFVKTVNGNDYELDVLILATGFKAQEYFSPMKIFGRNGVDILAQWKKDRPQAYLGILSWQMPNLFTILGPYTQVGHNSQIFNIECQVDWTIEAIRKMMELKASKISIKKEAENEFMVFIEETIKDKVWAKDKCSSWYLSESGENTMLWPHSQVDFWKWCNIMEDCLFEFDYVE